MPIQNLAQFKRCLIIGSQWRTTWGKRTVLRTVELVQTNGVQFSHVGGHTSGSWLYFRKAGNFTFNDNKVQLILPDGKVVADYEYAPMNSEERALYEARKSATQYQERAGNV